MAERIRIGAWMLEVSLNRLRRDDELVTLEPLATEALAYLARHPRKVVSTDELVDEVWGRKYVGDAPVYRVIAELRRALQDDARQPRYIETIRKRGYRLVADVEVLEGDGVAAPATTNVTISARPPSHAHAWFGLRPGVMILVVTAVVVGFLLLDRFLLNTGPEGDQSAVVDSNTASIAVLPFSNLSEGLGNEHFGDALAEELLNLLATVDGLRVAARTSSFHFKDKNPTIGQVADLLDVATVLEGSVQRSDGKIRINVRLVDARSSEMLWSERYERPLADIFALQDDIANRIVASLSPRLGGDAQPRIESDTGNITPDLFERFLLARYRFHEATDEGIGQARNDFLLVTKSAPGYAPAWAWLARSWTATRVGVPTEVARQSARDAIDTALMLDPDLAMAYIAEGSLHMRYTDFTAALQSFDRALALNPNLVDAHLERQNALVQLGEPELAIASLHEARSIDPLHPRVLDDLAHLLNLQGNHAEAFDNLDKLALVNPAAALRAEIHLFVDNFELGRALYLYEAVGQTSAIEYGFFSLALGLHDEIAEQAGSPFAPIALAVLGRDDEALEALDVVKERVGNLHLRSDVEFQTYIIQGDVELAHEKLWQRWSGQGPERAPAELSVLDRVALGAVIVKLGRLDEFDPIMEDLRRDAEAVSDLHTAIFNLHRGLVASVEGDLDAAHAYFSAAADEGFVGWWLYDTPMAHMWLFDDDPRFESVFAKLTENRDRQVAILNRLRQTQPTPAEVRQEFLADLAEH